MINKLNLFRFILKLAIILFIAFNLKSKLQQLYNINIEIENKIYQLHIKEIELSEIDKNKIKLNQVEIEFIQAKNKIPDYLNISKNIILINNICSSNNLKLKNIYLKSNSNINIDDSSIYKTQFELSTEGDFENINPFIKNLSNSEVFYSIEDIKINIDKEEFSKIDLNIATYSLYNSGDYY